MWDTLVLGGPYWFVQARIASYHKTAERPHLISQGMRNASTLGTADSRSRCAAHRLGHRKRLRQRFLKTGISGLAEYEMVELLLTLAIPRSDVKGPAKELLGRFGDLRGILDAPSERLMETRGIGAITPVALQIIKATAARYLQQKCEAQPVLPDASCLAGFWRMRIGSSQNEVFEVGFLNSGYRLITDGIEMISEGTVDRVGVYPRRVLEAALRRGAFGIVLAHNHPNGIVDPTEHDKALTRAIVLAAEAVGLRVVDHLIVSPGSAFSFRQNGLL